MDALVRKRREQAVETALLIKCLAYEPEDVGSHTRIHVEKLGVVLHSCNPRAQVEHRQKDP